MAWWSSDYSAFDGVEFGRSTRIGERDFSEFDIGFCSALTATARENTGRNCNQKENVLPGERV
jgi:hypothetical protein